MKVVILFNNCKYEKNVPLLTFAIFRANGKLTLVDSIYYTKTKTFKSDTMTLQSSEVYNLKQFFSIYN